MLLLSPATTWQTVSNSFNLFRAMVNVLDVLLSTPIMDL